MAVATRVDLDRFIDQGFLVVEDVLDPATDIDPVVAEYEDLLDQLTERWVAAGRLPSTYRELPFARRFARVLNEAPRDLIVMGHFDIRRSKASPRKR
jgi:hypothetical protein